MLITGASRRLRVGVVGTGNIGQLHAAALASIPRVDIAWLCNRSTDKASRLADQLRERPEIFESWGDALASSPAVDGVVVATPQMSHFEIGMAIAKAGVGCFMEKPMTQSAAESLQLARAADSSGIRHMVGFRLRHFATIRRLRGCCDDLRTLDVRMYDEPWVGDFWKFRPDMGGGNVMDQFCHCIDLVRFLARNDPITVIGQAGSSGPGEGTFDHLNACFRFGDGSLATVRMGDSGASPLLGKFSIEATSKKWRSSVYQRFGKGLYRSGAVTYSADASEERANREQMEGFIAVLRGLPVRMPTFWDGYAADHMLEKTLESARLGREVATDMAR